MAAPAPAPVSARTVPCPGCRKPTLFDPANPWRPFCSARCRSADLGAWASERFRLPAENPPDGADGAGGTPAGDPSETARH